MKRIFLIAICLFITECLSAQTKQQQLTLIVVIDRDISQDLINGKFFIKDKGGQSIDEMPFREWVGQLEMTSEDFKKLFAFKKDDTLYVTFKYNNYKLDTNYVYEGKIPKSLVNPRYLILNFYNKKNQESRGKYVFTKHQDYLLQVAAPGYGTILKTINKE